jgi:hypothetical protein
MVTTAGATAFTRLAYEPALVQRPRVSRVSTPRRHTAATAFGRHHCKERDERDDGDAAVIGQR